MKMESFKLNKGFFDLCVNVPEGGIDNLNDILLRLYESKLSVKIKDKKLIVFLLSYEFIWF